MATPINDMIRSGAQTWLTAGMFKALTRTVLGQVRFLNERRGSLPGLFTNVEIQQGTKGPEYLYSRGLGITRGEELQEQTDFVGIDLESYGVDFQRWTGAAFISGRLRFQEFTGRLLELTRQAFGMGLQRASELSARSVIEEVSNGSANIGGNLTLDNFIDILQHVKLGWRRNEYRPLVMGAPSEIRLVLQSGQMTGLYKSLMLAYTTNTGGDSSRPVMEYQNNESLLAAAVSDLRLPGGLRVIEDDTIEVVNGNATGILFGAGSIVRARAPIGLPVDIDVRRSTGDTLLEVNNWMGDNNVNPYVQAKITSSAVVPGVIS